MSFSGPSGSSFHSSLAAAARGPGAPSYIGGEKRVRSTACHFVQHRDFPTRPGLKARASRPMQTTMAMAGSPHECHAPALDLHLLLAPGAAAAALEAVRQRRATCALARRCERSVARSLRPACSPISGCSPTPARTTIGWRSREAAGWVVWWGPRRRKVRLCFTTYGAGSRQADVMNDALLKRF